MKVNRFERIQTLPSNKIEKIVPVGANKVLTLTYKLKLIKKREEFIAFGYVLDESSLDPAYPIEILDNLPGWLR